MITAMLALPLTRPRILIVDDVLVNIKYLLETLQQEYEVSYATSGVQALDAVSAYQPDLVLLDAMMPDLDGYQVCTRLRGAPETADLPIIFITALHSPEDETRALDCGASDFIIKPVNLAVLHARVRTQLAIKEQRERLRSLGLADPLTGLPNRRAFDQALDNEWRRCARSAVPLSLIIADVDHFKSFNDTYGHQAGDSCLKLVGGALRDAILRPHDLVARFGGEEFVILLPEIDLSGAEIVAARALEQLKLLSVVHDQSSVARYVTASLGVACTVPVGADSGTLVAAADGYLYGAKRAGRNRVASGMLKR